MTAHPSVTIVLPVLNEVVAIDACIESLRDQEYRGHMEIVVADGGSTDGTLERLDEWRQELANLTIIDNPARVQSVGVNSSATVATGDILVRADGHTVYEPDYVAASVRVLQDSGAIAVGGHMRPRGDSPFGSAVAYAMTSGLAIGPGRFHHVGPPADVDTVYLGAFRRDDFLAAGGYRTLPSGAAEDTDLYRRWRDSGHRVRLDPSIRSTYRPRHSSGALWRQYYAWGKAKAELLWANGRWPSWRPLAPLALILGLIGSVLILPLTPWPLWILLGSWIVVLIGAAIGAGRLAPLVFGAAAIMQLGYGIGLVRGLLQGPWKTRRALAG